MTILPLYAAPQYAPQVTDWLWQAFGGETLPRQFFASIVQHSQTAEALPLTFIAVEGEQLLGTIGLWRCDLISRQDLFPWLAALYVAPAARGQGLAKKLALLALDYAREKGIIRRILESTAFLTEAIGLYEHLGFEHIDGPLGCTGHVDCEVRMLKTL